LPDSPPGETTDPLPGYEEAEDAGLPLRAELHRRGNPAQSLTCCTALLNRVAFRTGLAACCALIVLAMIGMLSVLGLKPREAPEVPRRARGAVVVNTWWGGTTEAALEALLAGADALDAAQAACAATERSLAYGDRTVGPYGSPDSNGETTLDGLLQDGTTLSIGAVAYLRRVPSAIAAARAVLTYTKHTLLAGEGATALATSLGGQVEANLSDAASQEMFALWRANNCQPNFYSQHVRGANTSCGPYAPLTAAGRRQHGARRTPPWATVDDHDTVGVCVRDSAGKLAVGVSSNGASHKVAGRVGDAPIPGAGGYADSRAGCAACTGDGDITMRFLPSYQAVEFMRGGLTAQAACEAAVQRIMEVVAGDFSIGLVCLDRVGRTGAASHGWGSARFTSCTAEIAENNNTAPTPACLRLEPLS
jgi:N4-(beta-N-acetylglucosaminyl)-L-asparaginase